MDHEDDVTFEPTSIARCREILGDEGDGLSDIEVDQVRRHAEAMAHVIVDAYLEHQVGQE
jgi:hypothetical protein